MENRTGNPSGPRGSGRPRRVVGSESVLRDMAQGGVRAGSFAPCASLFPAGRNRHVGGHDPAFVFGFASVMVSLAL